MRLEDILAPQRLQSAIDIYLKHAFDDVEIARSHMVTVAPGADIDSIMALCEDTTEHGPEAHRRYELRLGSQEYPNMKLAIHEAWLPNEFMLTVDRHDAFVVDETVPDFAAWSDVRERNRLRKVAIEQAWYKAGLPTARRFKEEMLRPEDTAAVLGTHQILVVDDDGDAAEVVSIILQGAGFRCHIAFSAAEAKEYLAQPDVDCGMALVDVMLEDAPGYEVVKAIRQTPRVQEIPVLLMTGLQQSDVSMRDQQIHFLRKPYNGVQLVETVRRTLMVEYGNPDSFLARE